MRFRSYWGKQGGITVSGGEALLQIDFLIDLFKKAHERGINTNLDTAAQPFTREEPFFSKFNELLKYTDLVMLDIKHIDEEEHKKLTGFSNKNILDCARYLSEQGIPMWIRHVLVPGITDKDEYLKKTREFIDTLDTVMKVEVLPYHTLGEYKWKELGIPYKLEGVEPPTKERIENAKKILEFSQILIVPTFRREASPRRVGIFGFGETYTKILLSAGLTTTASLCILVRYLPEEKVQEK